MRRVDTQTYLWYILQFPLVTSGYLWFTSMGYTMSWLPTVIYTLLTCLVLPDKLPQVTSVNLQTTSGYLWLPPRKIPYKLPHGATCTVR